MAIGEDFGYLKDEEQSRFSVIVKRAMAVGAVLFSISCFIYITINAYYFVYHDQKGGVTLIKAPEGPIKVIEDDSGANDSIVVKDMDKAVYENIVGNKTESLEKVIIKTVRLPENPTLPKARQIIIDNAKNSQAVSTLDIGHSKSSQSGNDKMVIYNSEKDEEKTTTDHILADDKSDKIKENPAAANNSKSTKNNIPKSKGRAQLAALTSRASAEDYWQKIADKNPRLLAGLKHFIQEVNLGQKGIFYRLQVGDFRSQIEAEDFCSRFISQANKGRADCIVVE